MTLRVLENFAGIGTQRMALEKLGIEHEVVGITEIDKFAIKSYEAIHGPVNNLGDISLVDPNDVPDHDLFTYSFPCFTGDTLVLTDSGYKRIDEINIGDKVLTHTNQYKKVTNVFNQGVKDTVNVKGMAVHNIKTTENHKFLTRERHRVWNNDKRSYDRLFHEPQWVEAKDLTKDHYLGLSINQNSELPSWDGYTNSWGTGYGDRTYHTNFISPLLENNDFWWLMGRYVADGWHRKHGGIVIAVPDVKLEEFENRVNGLFDYNISKERTVNKVHISIKELSLFTEQFGYYAHGKKVSPEVLNLPVDLLKSFIEGYFSGDGSYLEDSKLYKCTTTSEELVYGIGQCIAKVYHRPYSIYKENRPATSVIEGRTVNQRDTYSLTFKMTTGKQDKAFYEDGHIWFPFNGLENDSKETVYDIEVEDDHSFTVFNTIVHNCQDISIAGKQKGFEKGGETRSGLLWECEKVIRAKKPKYLLMENVKNLVSKKFMPGFEEWLTALEELGYTNYWQVLNAKDYGIPQNRERVFCVSILGEHEPYEFPEKETLELRLKDILEHEVDEKFYLDDDKVSRLTLNWDKVLDNKDLQVVGNTSATGYNKSNVYHENGISPTLAARDYKGPNQVLQVCQYDTETRTNSNRFRTYSPDGISASLTTMGGGGREPHVLTPKRTEYGKAIRKYYEKGLIKESRHNMTEMRPRTDGVSNTLTTVLKDNYVAEPTMLIKNNTKQGYVEAIDGDGVDLAFPTSNTRRGRVQKGKPQTLDTSDSKGVVENLRIRKLTPKECWRLMGISDEDFEKAQEVNSNTQLYKQAGNAIVVDVLEAIFANMFK